MKRKISNCVCCNQTRQIYAKNLCSVCYDKQRKRSALEKSTKPIRKQSKRSQDYLRHYKRARDRFLKENPICMYPGCNSREVTLHHGAGRLGSFLTDKRYFKSLCWPHHQHIEQNPALARKLGLSYSRTSKHHERDNPK